MAETTPQRVRDTAAHLAGMTDEQLQMYIDDAALEVAGYKIKHTEYTEQLERYLAIHKATLNVRQAVSIKADGIAESYGDDGENTAEGLRSTKYGQEFLRLLRLAGGLSVLPLTVI